MSTRPATASPPRRAAAPAAARAGGSGRKRPSKAARAAAARRRRQIRRRRLAIVLTALVAGGGGAVVLAPAFEEAVQEITLPLAHEDIIRQQAADKDLDPALIAAVIFAESRFREQTSPAGAKGLMQITPDTAKDIARLSGGTAFTLDDLSDPQVNIAYGSFYLRHLLERYDGDTTRALAAYNGGPGNVDEWVRRFGGLEVEQIPFPETRHYVAKVQEARRDYRATYGAELGS